MHLRFFLSAAAALTAALSSFAQDSPEFYVSDTRYDWSGVADALCGDKSSPRDKHYAIYRWICDNIAYDTSYSIRTADLAYDNKRSVCQGYAELYYRIAEAAGLKADIITGKSKDLDGNIDSGGHAWIFAYTDPAAGIGMLIDPTWGAGSVNGNVFSHEPGDDSWFNVDPSWMIFSHFPDKEAYQLLDSPISYSQFVGIPAYRPFLRDYGFDGDYLLRLELKGTPAQMPDCYKLSFVSQANIPQTRKLSVGEYCEVALRTDVPLDHIAFLGSATHYDKGEWTRQDGISYGRVLVAREGDLTVSIKPNANTTMYSTLASYSVPAPTAAQAEKVDMLKPMQSKVWEGVENFNNGIFQSLPIDFAGVLAQVKSQRIKSLPVFYKGSKFSVGNIPWNGHLKIGTSYTFELIPYEGSEFAVINEDDWYKEWEQPDPNGPIRITVTPQKPGKLKVSVKKGDSYTSCFSYIVD